MQDYEQKLNNVAENKKQLDTQLFKKREQQELRRKEVQERRQEMRTF